MGRILQILTASLAVLSTASASAVIDLIPDNFDDIVLKSGKPTLVEFFAPWCGHCKKLAPIYEELATSFEFAKDKVSIAKVDADAEKDLGVRFGIQGFPTLKWFDGTSEEPVDYKSGRDLESLTSFITEKTGIRGKVKKEVPSAVRVLNDTTFKTEIGGDKDVLIAFTATWCGHCKTLAPTWEQLAQDFANEKGVLVAKMECDRSESKATAKEVGVNSFPTIKFYPKGSTEPVLYEGMRSPDDFVTFLNERAGTHRLPGGGLDSLGGTIASLDTLVANLKSGGDQAYTELEAAAGTLQDKYAEYYAKVAKKMVENQGYAEKEWTRLQGLIKKGGLIPEKSDDLVSRSNILNSFKSAYERVKDEL